MLGKTLNHVAAIETAAQNAVERNHHLCHLVLQSQVYQTEIVVAVEHVQVLDNLLVSDVAHAEAGSLVEDGESIAHTSVSLFGYHGERLLFILYAFLLSHHLQVSDGVGHGHALEVVNLTSAENGRQNLVLFGSGKDKDYMRRWLFQRFEEGVKVENENRTSATITYQNFFRMYHKLAGMTGTAKTEETEFMGIYNLDVVEIPTNKPVKRVDYNDVVCIKQQEKYNAIIEEIIRAHATGQPILVGTVSVEKSEYLSRLLTKRGIRHEVLNAKQHAKEADIVAQAGKFGNVTIATNMAGRGTDILLGGNPEYLAKREMRREGYDDDMIEWATSHQETEDEAILEARRKYDEIYKKHKAVTDAEHDKVVEVGGLYIIGTERHESRRIDNQLRGRAGRQGDPGATRFYVAMDDELMLRFGGDRAGSLMSRFLPEGADTGFELGALTKAIETTQKRVESHNYEIRKSVLKFDDVMNKMREIIYTQRRQVLRGADVHSEIAQMRDEAILSIVDFYCPEKQKRDAWDYGGLDHEFFRMFGIKATDRITAETTHGGMLKLLTELADERYTAIENLLKEKGFDMREVERRFLLLTVDKHWMDHIDAMDQLREGIGLRAMGNQDPVVQYRNEGFDMFETMTAEIRNETVMNLYHPVIRVPERRQPDMIPRQPGAASDPARNAATNAGSPEKAKPFRVAKKIGPNDPCPCGSGKKYKKCCGRTAD